MGSPFTAGHAVAPNGLFGVSIDPSGRFLYVVNQTEAKIYGFAIGSDGALTAIAGSPFAASGMLLATITSTVSSNQFLFVTDSANNVVSSYRIDSTTGSLTPASSANTAAGPSYLSSVGGVLYVTNVSGASINGFALNSDGTLTPVPGSPFSLPSPPSGNAVIATQP